MQRNGSSRIDWIFHPVYIPLDPHGCMCSSMQSILLSNNTCESIDECNHIRCNASNTAMESFEMNVTACHHPPNPYQDPYLDFKILMGHIHLIHNVHYSGTTRLSGSAAILYLTMWKFDYSMDIEASTLSQLQVASM